MSIFHQKPRRAKLTFKQAIKRYWPYYVMLLPFLLMFAMFLLIPIISAVVLSFTNFNMLQAPQFTGLQNYVRLFLEDEVFMKALQNTLLFAIITGPLGYLLCFVVAWLVNELNRKLRSIITLLMYVPTLAGNMYFIWMFIFAGDSRGLMNSTLIKLGLIQDSIQWLSDPKYNFSVVVIVIVWMSLGAGFLSMVAGFQALDRSYFEAAAIDGVRNRWQELYYVTLPQMGPQLLFSAIISISTAFAVGLQNMVLTGFPSTNYSTHTILLHMLDYGNTKYEMGYACAIAVVLFGIMLLSWLLITKVLGKFTSSK